MFDPFYPFDWLATQLVTQLFHLPIDSHLGSSLHFFFYDVPKVLTLLIVISFAIGTIKGLLPPEKVKNWLSGKRTILGNIMAATVGIVTPFCSCSAVPLFIGLLEGGVPVGVTFSYLISAPMTNEIAIALLWGLFGLKVTLIYISFGVTLAIFSGYIIGQLKLERWVEPFVWEMQKARSLENSNGKGSSLMKINWKHELQQGWYSAREILQTVWLYVVIGIGVGAVIHGFIPTELVVQWAGRGNPFAVPIAVLIGAPLYANIAGVLPITEALVNKGMPLGTVLAFTMSVTAISFPEMVILRKVLRPQFLIVFASLVIVGIITIGYLFNAVI
jgi:uncharacterized protein